MGYMRKMPKYLALMDVDVLEYLVRDDVSRSIKVMFTDMFASLNLKVEPEE